MNLTKLFAGFVCALSLLPASSVLAQESTTPATEAEREALYNDILARRVGAIMDKLALKDTNKVARVSSALQLQYRALRLRDEFIDARLTAEGKDAADFSARAKLRNDLSASQGQWFASLIAFDLTPEQIETVKDAMTYGKVKVTFDAYCEIIPQLSETDKAKVMELLKAARDEAILGGSAPEKSAIFQVYKDKINSFLDASGHDTKKAFKEWEEKHGAKRQVATGK
jgi:hypothetical protein